MFCKSVNGKCQKRFNSNKVVYFERDEKMRWLKWSMFLVIIPTVLLFYAGCSNTIRNADSNALEQLDAVIKFELEKEAKSPRKDRVLVALYLDTEGRKSPETQAEYRCYNRGGGGYSGIKRVPYRTPWTSWERVRSNDFKKEIVIDPDPPYKNFRITTTLIPGKVNNLGRIVLEKVKPKGVASILEIIGIKETASICGTVKDENGEPLEGVEVTSGKSVVTTNAEGFYRMKGFGLEVCNLEIAKEGYIPNNRKVSIRNMDKRIIKQDFVLSFPRKVRFRYVISPKEQNNFNSPEAVEGTVECFVDKNFVPLVVEQIKDKDLSRFIDDVQLKFKINNNTLTLRNFYAPIFYKRYRSSSEEFETISSVGTLNYNSQHCPSGLTPRKCTIEN